GRYFHACFGLVASRAYTLNRRAFCRHRPENFITDFIGAELGPAPTTRLSTTSHLRMWLVTSKQPGRKPRGFIFRTTGSNRENFQSRCAGGSAILAKFRMFG